MYNGTETILISHCMIWCRGRHCGCRLVRVNAWAGTEVEELTFQWCGGGRWGGNPDLHPPSGSTSSSSAHEADSRAATSSCSFSRGQADRRALTAARAL